MIFTRFSLVFILLYSPFLFGKIPLKEKKHAIELSNIEFKDSTMITQICNIVCNDAKCINESNECVFYMYMYSSDSISVSLMTLDAFSIEDCIGYIEVDTHLFFVRGINEVIETNIIVKSSCRRRFEYTSKYYDYKGLLIPYTMHDYPMWLFSYHNKNIEFEKITY